MTDWEGENCPDFGSRSVRQEEMKNGENWIKQQRDMSSISVNCALCSPTGNNSKIESQR